METSFLVILALWLGSGPMILKMSFEEGNDELQKLNAVQQVMLVFKSFLYGPFTRKLFGGTTYAERQEIKMLSYEEALTKIHSQYNDYEDGANLKDDQIKLIWHITRKALRFEV